MSLWLTYSFIGPGYLEIRNSNIITRMGLAFSIVDHGSVQLGEFSALTSDTAVVNGNHFADKAPGMSFMALPVIAVAKTIVAAAGGPTEPIVDGRVSEFFWLCTWLASVFTSALFTALSAAVFFIACRKALQASLGAALFGALVFGAATPIAGWATIFFGHAMAGACLIMAFSLILLARVTSLRDRLLGGLIGGLLTWSVVVEFTSAPAALIIGLFGLVRLCRMEPARRLPLLMSVLGGAVIAGIPLAVYNQIAFGSIFHVGYENVVGFDGMRRGFLGLSMPDLSVLGKIIYGRYRGIMWISPILLLVPISYWAAARALPKDVMLVVAAVPVCYLLINSGYFYWDGGASTGPRHITPSMGFLALTFVPLWDHFRSGMTRSGMIFIAVTSAMVTLICALITMASPEYVDDPLIWFIAPRFIIGCFHNIFANTYMICNYYGTHGSFATLLWLPALWFGAAGLALLVNQHRGSRGTFSGADRTAASKSMESEPSYK